MAARQRGIKFELASNESGHNSAASLSREEQGTVRGKRKRGCKAAVFGEAQEKEMHINIAPEWVKMSVALVHWCTEHHLTNSRESIVLSAVQYCQLVQG